MTDGVASPLSPVLGQYAAELPAAFREQFLTPADANYRIVLEGKMHRVWRRHSWLWPLFWLAAQFEMLFPETGRDVQVTLVITSSKGKGESHQTWRRTFDFARKRRFTSRMVYDQRLGRAIELIDPAGLLGLAWDIRFHKPSTLELRGVGWVLRVGNWRLRLPDWLLGTGVGIERADESREDAIDIDLTLSHPLLGPVFGYNGTFQLRREPTID